MPQSLVSAAFCLFLGGISHFKCDKIADTAGEGSKILTLTDTTLTSALTNRGYLTLNGTLTVTDLSEFNADMTYTFSEEENGYRTTNGAVRVVDNTGTLNVENVSLAGELATGSMTAGIVVRFNHTDNNTYWVNTEADAADVGGAALADSGMYRFTDVDRITAENAVSMGDDWSCTVLVQNCVACGINLNQFANETSKLLINGLSGWLQQEGSTNMAHHLILGENGLTISDSCQRRYRFNGGLSGTGDFIIATTSSYKAEFELKGDLSEWDGAFRVTPHSSSTNTARIYLYVTAGGTFFSGESDCGIFLERKGEFNVFIGNALADPRIAGDIINAGVRNGESVEYGTLALNLSHNTEIDGVVSVSSVFLSAGANAVFNESLTAGKAVTNVTFCGSREINVNMETDGYGEFHVTLDDENLAEGSDTVTLKGDVTADSLTVKEGTKTVLESDVNVQKLVVSGSAELAEQTAITVDTVTVQAADGEGEKRITMADLSLTGLEGYGRESAVASLISVTAESDFSFSDISLIEVKFSAENTELSLNNVRLSQDGSFSVGSLGSIQPDSVLLDVDTEELMAAGYRNVTLDLGEDVTYGELSINLAGAIYTGNSNGRAQFSLNVPEPGAVTLSLLVLASLAARRRRR